MWTLTRWLIANRLETLDAEEVFNSVTHAIGLGLAAMGAFLLVVLAAYGGSLWSFAGVTVYGATLVFLYAASTVYHGVAHRMVKTFLRRMDHFGIKLLIAGSYTPFVLSYLRDGPGLWLGFVVWGFVAIGAALQFAAPPRIYYKVSLALYLGMGFACLPFLGVLLSTVPTGAMLLLALGGAAYVIGVIFYVWESLPFSHGIWHLFVLAGSALHYVAVLRYATLGA